MKEKGKKWRNLIKFVCFVVMLILFAYLGTKNYTVEVSDNIRFTNEYNDISKNNVFTYVNENEVLDILNGKSGIIFYCFSSNIWCHYYADYLNEMAMLNDVSTVYYYDFKRDRSLENSTYHSIVRKLKEYLVPNDQGKMDISAPTITMIKNGEILYFENEISTLKGEMTPEEYFTDIKKNVWKATIDLAIKEYVKESGENDG